MQKRKKKVLFFFPPHRHPRAEEGPGRGDGLQVALGQLVQDAVLGQALDLVVHQAQVLEAATRAHREDATVVLEQRNSGSQQPD